MTTTHPPEATIGPGQRHRWLDRAGYLTAAWAGLYGTVTLEVFGHIDPRIVDKALLFRAMLEDQAIPLGLADELPRLRELMARMLA